MAQMKVVAEKPADPRTGTTRRQSAFATPYYNLAQSIEVARVIYQRAGGACDRAQLSAMLGYKGVKNGSFLTRVTAAKLFGLIEQKDEQVPTLSITDLGKAIVAPVTAAGVERAKVEAFLGVPLFRKVYDEYRNGTELPPKAGLRNQFITSFGIIPDRAGPAVEVLMDSAAEAGFFKVGGEKRLVAPLIVSGGSDEIKPPPKDEGSNGGGGGSSGGGGNGGGGQDTSAIHPAIYGLIANLPKPGAMSVDERQALIDAFTATVKFIYAKAS
jgi:uncharacterized membrane protein YgcG